MKNKVESTYNNEPVNIPDIDKEWQQFEIDYFGKKKRRYFFLIWFSFGLICLASWSVYISHVDRSETNTKVVTRTMVKSESRNKNMVSEIATVFQRETKKDVVLTNEKAIKAASGLQPGKRAVAKISEKVKDAKTALINQPSQKTEIEPSQTSETLFAISVGHDSLSNLNKNEENKNDLNSSTIDFAGIMNDTSADKANPLPLTRSKGFDLHFDNLINPALQSSFFNPELSVRLKQKNKDAYFQAGFGMGINHFNSYEFTRITSHTDNFTGNMFKDSFSGHLKSSIYCFVPITFNVPINKNFQLNMGTTVLFPVSNRFEVNTYSLETSEISPNWIDTLANIKKTSLERHYKVTPSVRLSCDLVYHIKSMSINCGVRQTVYNGLRTLNLPSSSIPKPSLMFVFGLGYKF